MKVPWPKASPPQPAEGEKVGCDLFGWSKEIFPAILLPQFGFLSNKVCGFFFFGQN